MKKLAYLGVLLCFALTVFLAIPSATPAAAEEADLPVIYVYDEQEWDLHVYCYANGVDFGSGWPGMELDRAPELGEDWYSFTMPQDPTGKTVSMIIFDNSKDTNRIEFVFNKSNLYCNTYTAKGFASKQAAEDDAKAKRPALVNTIYIYNYSKDDGAERWESVYATCYNNKTGEKLGQSVTLEPAPSSMGDHWYQYNLPEEAKAAASEDYKFRARVEIRDGEEGRESLDIVAPVEKTKYYNTYREYGFDSATKASSDEFNCVYENPKTGTTRLYFYNTQRWKTVYAYAYWTYVGANNASVEDFGPWPGKRCTEDATRENWYYIDLPQDPAKMSKYGATGVGVVFNNTKAKIKKDVFIGTNTGVYANYDGTLFAGFEACEAASTMIDPLPEVGDFMLDFGSIDTTEKTENVTQYKSRPESAPLSLTAPIVVLSLAAAICIGVGAVLIIFTVRRKQK